MFSSLSLFPGRSVFGSSSQGGPSQEGCLVCVLCLLVTPSARHRLSLLPSCEQVLEQPMEACFAITPQHLQVCSGAILLPRTGNHRWNEAPFPHSSASSCSRGDFVLQFQSKPLVFLSLLENHWLLLQPGFWACLFLRSCPRITHAEQCPWGCGLCCSFLSILSPSLHPEWTHFPRAVPVGSGWQ